MEKVRSKPIVLKKTRSQNMWGMAASATLLCCLVGFAAAVLLPDGLWAAGQDDVKVTVNDTYKETSYCIAKGDCLLCWETYQTDLNKGVISNRSRCDATLADQSADLEIILNAVLTRDADGPNLKTLFWRGLAPDYKKHDQELSQRLCMAAFRSPEWDRVKGRPRKGDINAFVKKIAHEAMIYPELRALFEKAGKQLTLSSVEKVLVYPAEKLPFFKELQSQGVKAKDKLPFDCLTWFRIEPGQ